MRWGRTIQSISLLASFVWAGTAMAGPHETAAALSPEAPTPAIFDLEETGTPYLGYTRGDEAVVTIGVESPGYQDRFTIYFPRGTSQLTLAGADMVALAAEAVLMSGEGVIWISPGPALTTELGFARSSQIQDGLLNSGIPSNWIRIDDGSLEAILERPAFLNGGQDI